MLVVVFMKRHEMCRLSFNVLASLSIVANVTSHTSLLFMTWNRLERDIEHHVVFGLLVLYMRRR